MEGCLEFLGVVILVFVVIPFILVAIVLLGFVGGGILIALFGLPIMFLLAA